MILYVKRFQLKGKRREKELQLSAKGVGASLKSCDHPREETFQNLNVAAKGVIVYADRSKHQRSTCAL